LKAAVRALPRAAGLDAADWTWKGVREDLDPFFAGIAARSDEVRRRCRTVLQSQVEALVAVAAATALLWDTQHATQVDPSLASV
jgi:hypothetical protein